MGVADLWDTLRSSAQDVNKATSFQRIPNPRDILNFGIGALQIPIIGGDSPASQPAESLATCPNPQLSCQSDFTSQDTCCFNYPGGQFLQTQFWDAEPAYGPDDHWTIHGLWPNHCDGTFDQNCDRDRHYTNITDILNAAGREELVDFMSTYWKDYRGNDEYLWQHEWNKHGTCVSTLETKCYADYVPQQEVVDYFNKTVDLFQMLPSYETLSDAGIVPSDTQTYSFSAIQGALEEAHGSEVVVRCRNGAINEIRYYFHVSGSVRSGDFVPSSPGSARSNCPMTGIKYIPKRSRSVPTQTSDPTVPTKSPSKDPFIGKGHLDVWAFDRQIGCIISHGTWFTSGTCATFVVEPSAASDGFTLTSSKGACSFKGDILNCGPEVKDSTTFNSTDGKLSFNNKTQFYAEAIPRGTTQAKIYSSGHRIPLEISWRGA
ncbi:ribonuclease T2-like [Arachnomyces sp. PD_36]|nr:ribonuclease T2-like [Arachnomyces sp. PD_36]